ncbi:uncharacterized protein [Littorina saxatilis]|uniref:G-protein coupled receptors family 3 profile domain-containing protein n=1 Tax=Littorina saxatilis TaxID=31220 RepID=A0AAN9AID3_9CAEN
MWQGLPLLVVLCWVPDLSQTLTFRRETCDASRKHVSVQTNGANVLLGGLFDIREPGTGGTGCGLPSTELMQVYEAARWTISELNRNNYVTGVKFGMEAYDSCTLAANALAGVQDFYPQVVGREGTNSNSSRGTYCSQTSPTVYKLGLLGPMQSSISLMVGELAPNIPASVVSMRSSSPLLSNKNKYPTFLRTDQSASVFARAVTKFFDELDWKKIVIVYSDNAYGTGGYMEVLGAASAAGICVSGVIAVPHVGSVSEYEEKLRGIGSYGATAALFYGNPSDALTLLQALQSLQGQTAVRDIKWLFGQLDIEGDFSAYTAAQGAIVAQPTSSVINGFKSYYTGLNVGSPPAENPWLQDWFMKKNRCRLSGVSYAPFNTYAFCTSSTINPDNFKQSYYVERTILAILAYAEAIRTVCPGANGVCNQLSSMEPRVFHDTYLSKVNLRYPDDFFIPEFRRRQLAFDVNGDPLTSSFTFFSYVNSAFTQFATYDNGNLAISSTPTFPRPGSANLPTTSLCSANGCTNCLQPARGITLAYKPGDIVVAALVDAHEPDGQGLNCGEVIPDRLIDAVAVRYGTDNAGTLGSRGVSVGYLIVDVCPGLTAAQSFLTNLLGGYKLYTDANGNIISTSNIVTFLDMTREDTAWKIAPILSSVGMPQIRVASTSKMLLRNPEYPLVVSAVPSEETVQLAIVQMLSVLKWNYVQIISEAEGSYYRAAENFRRLASRMKICVAMWSTFGMDPVATVNRLRDVQDAPIVVVFGTSSHFRSTLEAVKTVTAASQRQLTFVSGSEEFGTSDNVVAGYTNEARGSILLQLAQRADTGMDSWLSGLSLSEIASDMFLAEWFEEKNRCSLTAASRQKFDLVCSSTLTISQGDVDQGYAPYIIRGIRSVAEAVNSALDTTCGQGTTGLCSGFRSLPKTAIVNSLRNSNDNTEFKIMDGEGMSDFNYFNYNNGGFTSFGTFDTDTRRITSLLPAGVIVGNGNSASMLNTGCTGRCAQCQYAYSYQEFGYMPGDWLIAGTFSISDPGPEGQRPYVCGDVRTEIGFQYTAAVMFALDRINSGRGNVKLNNVRLGALLMDHCNNERRAYGQVADIYSGLTELTWPETMGNASSRFMSSDVLAWLTDTTASSREAGEILQPLGVSIVSPSATAASLMNNPTFFRTVQGDATTAMAIVKLCKTLGISFIQAVYAADDYGREGFNTLTNTARQEGICVINSFEMVEGSNANEIVSKVSGGTTKVVVLFLGTSTTRAFLEEASLLTGNEQLTVISPEPHTNVVNNIPNRGRLVNLLSLQVQDQTIAEFNTYLNNIDANSDNPFFARYYMKLYTCNLPGYYMYNRPCTSTNNIQPSHFAHSTINAVYAVAGALQDTLVEFCGNGYSGECPAFLQSPNTYSRFVENLKTVQFDDLANRQFRFLDREGNVVYDVLRYDGGQYNTVGSYGGASLTIPNLPQLMASYSSVTSECSAQCAECIFNQMEFSHTPGDIYLGGVFDVHSKGQGVFDCGNINTEHGFQLLEAFHFALEMVNSNQGIFADILQGVTLGGVGLDACESAIRGGYLVSNINNGLTKLVRDGREISPEEIDVYIGSYSSDSSIYLARILTDLETPQISYASTSNTLENNLIYPYFFRTVPADDKQVLGMLKYLDQNNLRYVQLLYTDDSYGLQGINQFDLLIRMHNFSICVAQRVVFPESGVVSQESSDDAVVDLLQKPVANTVVIFAGTNYIRAFLEAVQRSPAATRSFKFVGPSTWGASYAVTEKIPEVGNDAVTFALDFQGGVGGFMNSYLELRNPTNAGNNPWFEEWFQHILNCYTSPTNNGRYPVACSSSATLGQKVVEDLGILHVMNAVYSAAFALDSTLKEKCGENYAAVCEAYRSNKQRRTSVRDKLEMVNFTDPTGVEFRFIDRAGNKGYKLFKFASSPLDRNDYNRLNIGNFTSDNKLQVNMALAPKYNGSCERKDACVECPTVRNRGVRYAMGGDLNGKATIVGIFDVHQRGSELYQCGPINMEGFYQFLSFFWTYNEVAQASNIRLLALDTCSNSMRVGQDLYGLLKDGELCNTEPFDMGRLGLDNISGVVVTGEENTMAAARLLEPLMVTYMSADSVSPLMDSYQYLLRARAPWSAFASILSKFLKDSGWTYVNTMYYASGLGNEEYIAFQKASTDSGICLGGGLAIPDGASDNDIRTALAELDSSSGANVVVLLTPPAVTMRILSLAQELGIADDYLWIFGIDDPQVLNIIPAGVSFQALILRPVVPPQTDFSTYVSNLEFDPNHPDRNRAAIPKVWWEDVYQTVLRCRLADADYPSQFTFPCARNLTIGGMDVGNKSVHYTYLATAFSALGFDKFYEDCLGGESVQGCLRRRQKPRKDIRDAVLNYVHANGFTYEFNKPMRYVETDYDIFVVDVENGMVKGEPEKYKTYSRGSFTPYTRLLQKESVCQNTDGCGCNNINPFAQPQTGDQFKPTSPRNYYKYNSKLEQVYEWPVWAIVMGVLTCLGLLVTIIAFIYLIIAYPIKGGTSVLGYLTMIGIMGIYAINFAFFLHASDATCGARRFVMGVVYTIVFASLLVKAVDNWRFANMEYSNNQYRGITNSCTLFLMALGIILIQCIIPIEWLILVHPTATKYTSANLHDYWWCDPHDFYDVSLVLSFIFVIFIVILTAIFAGLAWDSEQNNRESRWILVSAIATAGCFLVWMIVTTNALPVFRDPAIAIANFINATLLLIFIPLRKMHLLCQSNNEKPEEFSEFDQQYGNGNTYTNESYNPEDDYTFGPMDKSADDEFID